MSVSTSPDRDLVTDIATYLRDIGCRASGLSPQDRRALFRTCLAYRLRDVPGSRVTAVLQALAVQFGIGHAPASVRESGAAGAPVSAEVIALVRELVRLIDGDHVASPAGDELASLRAAVQKLTDGATALRSVLHKPGLPLDALIERAARDLAAHDAALEKAARESFDRVLGALSPESMKQHVARKTLSTDAMYKAALFDAAVEKFRQLELYHSKDRLVRDYKTAYKRYVREESSH